MFNVKRVVSDHLRRTKVRPCKGAFRRELSSLGALREERRAGVTQEASASWKQPLGENAFMTIVNIHPQKYFSMGICLWCDPGETLGSVLEAHQQRHFCYWLWPNRRPHLNVLQTRNSIVLGSILISLDNLYERVNLQKFTMKDHREYLSNV